MSGVRCQVSERGSRESEKNESVFDGYSRYYDLLYADKDYPREADYVHALLCRFGSEPNSVLEFGSGTGRHALLLAEKGYQVTGVEHSPRMAALAQSRSCSTANDRKGAFRCIVGDVRSTVVDGSFDAAMALFHVVSYQTANQDVDATFANAHRHLEPHGLFLFDAWHAPAVLTQRPSVRVKRVEDESVHLTRIAEPQVDTTANCVRVHYTLFAKDKATGQFDCLSETHLMRYFSLPEIEWLAGRHGFEMLHSEEWLTGTAPSEDTWGVAYVLRKTT